MTRIIIVRNLKDMAYVNKVLINMERTLPEFTSQSMMKWGKHLERNMKQQAMGAEIKPFTRTLFGKGIEWRQRPKGRIGRLFIRQYGIYLSEMQPPGHYVSVYARRSRLLAWAKQSGKYAKKAGDIEKGTRKRFPIFVRPHPFIRKAYFRSRMELKPLLKEAVTKAVKSA